MYGFVDAGDDHKRVCGFLLFCSIFGFLYDISLSRAFFSLNSNFSSLIILSIVKLWCFLGSGWLKFNFYTIFGHKQSNRLSAPRDRQLNEIALPVSNLWLPIFLLV